jgi:hypothetical protein
MNRQITTIATAKTTSLNPASARAAGRSWRRGRLITLATMVAVAAVPAAASATTSWFGSSLNHDPANAGNTCADNGVLGPALCTHVGSFYPGNSGKARAPFNGTVTAFKVRAQGPMTATLKIVAIRNLSADHESGQAKTIAVGPTVQIKGPTQDELENGISPIETFKVNLKVKKGQAIAIDTTSNTAEYCSDGTPGQLLFSPRLKRGQQFRTNDGVDGCLMLIQAVIRS